MVTVGKWVHLATYFVVTMFIHIHGVTIVVADQEFPFLSNEDNKIQTLTHLLSFSNCHNVSTISMSPLLCLFVSDDLQIHSNFRLQFEDCLKSGRCASFRLKNLLSLSADQIRVESLYQDSSARYSVDSILSTLNNCADFITAVDISDLNTQANHRIKSLTNLLQVLPHSVERTIQTYEMNTLLRIITMSENAHGLLSIFARGKSEGAWGTEAPVHVQHIPRLSWESTVNPVSPFDEATSSFVRMLAMQARLKNTASHLNANITHCASCFNADLDICRSSIHHISEEDLQVLGPIKKSLQRRCSVRRGGGEEGEGGVSEKKKPSRLLCMTYTLQVHHDALEDILHTWAPRCDGFLAFSDTPDPALSALRLRPRREDWHEAYDEMWLKSQLIWKLVAGTLLDEYDFFLIGGDDLFVIVENVRRLLDSRWMDQMSKRGEQPVYFGRTMKQNSYLRFNSGGAGYVLNRAAVMVLTEALDSAECLPTISTSMEDLMVAQCLLQRGVKPIAIAAWGQQPANSDQLLGDHCAHKQTTNNPMRSCNHVCSSKSSGQANDHEDLWSADGEIFHPLSPRGSFLGGAEGAEGAGWYRRMTEHFDEGTACCSPHSATFQNIRRPVYDMRCLDVWLYCVDEVQSAINP